MIATQIVMIVMSDANAFDPECVIGGYTVGNPFDALIIGCYDAGDLRYVSKVTNGFNPRLRRDLYVLLRSLEKGDCPFVNLPETRRSRWGLTLTKEEDGKLPVASAQARGPSRIHGVDAGWAFEAFELCRATR